MIFKDLVDGRTITNIFADIDSRTLVLSVDGGVPDDPIVVENITFVESSASLTEVAISEGPYKYQWDNGLNTMTMTLPDSSQVIAKWLDK